MEKQFKEDQLTGRLMNEAGLEKPSLNFTANVMKAIYAKQEMPVYKPLMTATGWFILSSMLIFSMIGLYYTNTGTLPLPDINLNFQFDLTFPTIELSQTMSLAICCLLLFLLQIPFLKSLIERELR